MNLHFGLVSLQDTITVGFANFLLVEITAALAVQSPGGNEGAVLNDGALFDVYKVSVPIMPEVLSSPSNAAILNVRSDGS